LDTDGYAYRVVVEGGIAYLADGHEGLRIIDVSSSSTPLEVGFFNTGGTVKDVSIREDYAFISDDAGGTIIVDISVSL